MTSFSHVAHSWFLTGPTAAGKSAVAIELARRVNGEIVSMDSMAVYRGMDIGTAKPTADERAAVPHHLIDIVEPAEQFSLAQYVAAAEACAADILARGQCPTFVGGTPLYLKALLRGIFQGPPADWQFREQLTAEAAHHGGLWLHEQVRTVDPVSAGRLHPQDTKRLVRVLEVHEKTGRPISQLQQEFDRARPPEECRVMVLDWPRDVLYRRINARVQSMFSAGLVDEVRGLVDTSRDTADPSPKESPPARPARDIQCAPATTAANQSALGRTARQALGYREVIEYLAGARSLDATIELVQNRTRAFARRQLTWFRSLAECRPVPCTEQDSPEQLAARIVGD